MGRGGWEGPILTAEESTHHRGGGWSFEKMRHFLLEESRPSGYPVVGVPLGYKAVCGPWAWMPFLVWPFQGPGAGHRRKAKHVLKVLDSLGFQPESHPCKGKWALLISLASETAFPTEVCWTRCQPTWQQGP